MFSSTVYHFWYHLLKWNTWRYLTSIHWTSIFTWSCHMIFAGKSNRVFHHSDWNESVTVLEVRNLTVLSYFKLHERRTLRNFVFKSNMFQSQLWTIFQPEGPLQVIPSFGSWRNNFTDCTNLLCSEQFTVQQQALFTLRHCCCSGETTNPMKISQLGTTSHTNDDDVSSCGTTSSSFGWPPGDFPVEIWRHIWTHHKTAASPCDLNMDSSLASRKPKS